MRNLFNIIFFLALISGSHFAYSSTLVENARKQIGVTVSYDPQYRKIDFPMGDVASTTGVCTDVVIRAYRQQGLDLQQAVNQDMRKAWAKYPKLWGLKRTDPNIDHRRVPNLETFFSRYGQTLSLTELSTFQAGDIFTWLLPKNLPHIGIVSNKKSSDGTPLIIHNIGRGTQKENVLFKYKIVGHYRLPENMKVK